MNEHVPSSYGEPLPGEVHECTVEFRTGCMGCSCKFHGVGGTVDQTISGMFLVILRNVQEGINTGETEMPLIYPFSPLERAMIETSYCSCDLVFRFVYFEKLLTRYFNWHLREDSKKTEELMESVKVPIPSKLHPELLICITQLSENLSKLWHLVDSKHKRGLHVKF